MTLEQLRIFVAVAEREHVTRAAAALNLTQSATSAAIAALEERYRVKLFDRIGRGIVLTDAGRRFLPEARAVLARTHTAETMLTDLAGLRRGSLSLAASQTVASYWLPRFMHRFRQRHPEIELSLRIGNTASAAAWVRDGSAEMGFVEGAVDDPALSAEPVAEDALVLVVTPQHPWVGTPPPTLEELAAGSWVVREPGSGTREMLWEVLTAHGVALDGVSLSLELPSNEAVRAAVEAGAGATVISRLVVADSLAAGTLRRVELDMPTRRFTCLRHKERHVTRAAEAFRRLISED